MTYQNDCTLPNEIVEQITEQGLDYLPDLIRVVVNAAMKAERQQYLGVSPYERSVEQALIDKLKLKKEGGLSNLINSISPKRGSYYENALKNGQKLLNDNVSNWTKWRSRK